MTTRVLEVRLPGSAHLARQHEAGNFARTLDYVPGTALRGALAARSRGYHRATIEQCLSAHGATFDSYFSWVFLSGRVTFSNLYPAFRNGGGTRASFVVPLSARTCKLHPGLEGDRGAAWEQPHGVVDALLSPDAAARCSKCGALLGPIGGFYTDSEGAPVRRVTPGRRLLGRTAIDDATGKVTHGALYSLEVVEAAPDSMPFLGTLRIRDGEESDQLKAFKHLLLADLDALHEDNLHLGGDRTRGLGAVHVRLGPENLGLDLPSVATRLERLQAVQPGCFSLTLHSDAIILDELWRYRSVIDAPVLSALSGSPQCKLERAFTQTRVVSGWNAAHRLPKENELAIVKGAAFLFSTAASPAEIGPWLESIEREGMGERRSEGFGEVIACHPFHLEVRR